jgi:hypothetical protein
MDRKSPRTVVLKGDDENWSAKIDNFHLAPARFHPAIRELAGM